MACIDGAEGAYQRDMEYARDTDRAHEALNRMDRQDDLDRRRERHIQAQLEGRDPEWGDSSAEADYLPWQIWYRLEWSGEWIALRGERYPTLAAAEERIATLYRTTTNRRYRASFF